ncbi:MAG TPA: PAS domain-containing protein [Candidatus Acutalibacter ornithocaccae]|uniref:histidine kinase n=1 Tax=Candidatus Acutalibacter ornithocaccae TaxID=2838416 RepID=A0A9D2LZS4_9FIRM|nr:PAS domain-containing protein [Candidatus Acutalibacter ornithocaccae]
MRKKIFKNMCLLALVTILLSSLLVTIVYYANSDVRMKSEVREETRFVRGAVELSGQDYLATVENTANRITLIDTDGTVLYDNQADPATMENHSDREEFQEASTAGAGEATRISDTIAEQTFYYAVKLQNGQVLRVAATTDSVFAAVLAVLPWILGVEVLVAVCTVLFSNFLTKKIVAPINRLDLDHPADNEIYDELSPLLGKISRQNEVIAQQMKSLREKQEEFTSITENMSEGFLVLDNNTDILSYNTSALRLLGAEAVPAESHVSALALNRSAGFRSAVDGALAGKRSEQLVRQGGRCCQVMANPVLRDGEVEGAVVVILDITEREERENLRREFTANVSHELKTPLTSISGFAEIIKNGIVKPEDIPRFAGNIYEESQRLVTLVDDILNLSRLDEADVQLEREDFDLSSLARDVAGRLKASAKKNGVVITVIGDKAEINGVKSIVDEMVFNLVDNAVKYNKQNGRVTVTVDSSSDGTALTVTDTGIGIPQADVDRVFERFYRVDKSHSKEIGGTGLGLSIVKHGAAFHNAKVSLQSTEGEGTTVRLVFPN